MSTTTRAHRSACRPPPLPCPGRYEGTRDEARPVPFRGADFRGAGGGGVQPRCPEREATLPPPPPSRRRVPWESFCETQNVFGKPTRASATLDDVWTSSSSTRGLGFSVGSARPRGSGSGSGSQTRWCEGAPRPPVTVEGERTTWTR